ncbi:sugar phosphate isomerase/epimerase family protein [Lapillicoccus jejuensis]|uniref:D-tagatose 3-epimerase n=1 Tax=Lapillicoccus jejuensis TaxID=402171 RepID=A0A542DVB4_9MICO|nr:sugar phosphate isomerase/epimerase family protein [Lapillicoccus jejuensis]TQJ07041.1 D-tagatose 3-epimerase [Lapillicoccus jejuensis]
MSNKIGVHALVWVGGWSPEQARTAIESTREAGYDLIELTMPDETFDAAMTAKLLQENGLDSAFSLGLSPETDISSDDPQVVARGREFLAGVLSLVRDTGSSYLGGVIFSKLGRYDAPVTERGRAHSVESIAWLADRAAASGITLGLEFCNRYETNVLNTTEQTLAFIADVDRPNVVAHLDVYHMNIEEVSFSGAVHAAADAGRLGYVHLGESHRGALGTGSVPFEEFFDALHEVGYDGTLTFESFSSRVVHPTLSSNLAIWRDTWDDSMALAVDAREFIRRGYGA